MTITAPAAELAQGYEALRAQALGELPPFTPRGLAVFLRGGLVSWMSACPPRDPPKQPRPTTSPRAGSREVRGLTGVSAELVRLLTEMALTSQRGCSL